MFLNINMQEVITLNVHIYLTKRETQTIQLSCFFRKIQSDRTKLKRTSPGYPLYLSSLFFVVCMHVTDGQKLLRAYVICCILSCRLRIKFLIFSYIALDLRVRRSLNL